MTDTRSKRASAVTVGRPFVLTLPIPDSAVVLGDRQHLGYAYSGELTAVVTFTIPPDSRLFLVEDETRVFIVAAENRVFEVETETRVFRISPDMSEKFHVIKDPNADLIYGIDLTDWLASGETVVTSTWTVPSGLTSHDPSTNGTVNTIWLRGGSIADGSYNVVNRFTTSTNQVDDRTIVVKMVER